MRILPLLSDLGTLHGKGANARSGFTLLEMSIVLTIVAVISAATMIAGNRWIEASRYRTTNQNFDLIDRALLNYIRLNRRLPCPGALGVNFYTANAGVEANNPGTCTGGTVVASIATGNLVGGSLPVDVLDLPRSMMTDGWGRRIVYYVDVRMTNYNAADSYPYDESVPASAPYIGVIQVDARQNDNSLAVRNAVTPNGKGLAVYALVSHGSDGHGAYLTNASRYFTGATDTDEWENCDCNATASTSVSANPSPDGVAAAAGTVLVQSSPNDSFDDIVRYKRRSQLYDIPQ